MKRDWLDINLIPGRQVRITIPTWLGPRLGYLTGDSHLAGTDQVRRWTIRLPHNRTKTKTFDVSVEAHNFEVL